jgi:hypothetical protein
VSKVLGLGSYRTAWLMLHKLRQAMVRPGREKLSGLVEVDETYWGSAEFGGATGRKTLSEVLIIVAAEANGKRTNVTRGHRNFSGGDRSGFNLPLFPHLD